MFHALESSCRQFLSWSIHVNPISNSFSCCILVWDKLDYNWFSHPPHCQYCRRCYSKLFMIGRVGYLLDNVFWSENMKIEMSWYRGCFCPLWFWSHCAFHVMDGQGEEYQECFLTIYTIYTIYTTYDLPTQTGCVIILMFRLVGKNKYYAT